MADRSLHGTRPRTAARLELGRALGGALLAPLRYAAHVPVRRRVLSEIREDVHEGAGVLSPLPTPEVPTDRPLRILIGAAEASGEIHGANLIQAIRARVEAAGGPAPEFAALGGERIRALDVPTIADPVARAHTGFDGVLESLPYYVGVIEDTARHARTVRPDLFIPVDSPALNVPLAHAVRRYGVKTCHLVAPQYWGWAPWRVRGYRRAMDLALTILPHEPAWYSRHEVHTRHIGHPLLDHLAETPVTRPDERSRVLALLPGSRRGVIQRNLPWMLDALEPLRKAAPDAEVRILQATDEHAALIGELARDHVVTFASGDLHGELARARSAFAVSGTILTDVLHHRLPTVVLYRFSKRLESFLYDHVLTTPFFASTNLLAGSEVLPEHGFRGEGPVGLVGAQVRDAFLDPETRARASEGLEGAARRLGPPGAIDRAAAHALNLATPPGATGAPARA